jgi:hypothetical protein
MAKSTAAKKVVEEKAPAKKLESVIGKEPMKETKEIAKTETNKALAQTPMLEGMEGIDPSDILIPKLHLMQGLSDLVAEGKASMGDIINSTTGEKLGDKKDSIEFVPVSTFKTWVIFEDGEYKQTIPMTPDNSHWLLEEQVGEMSVTRDKVLNFYVLLSKEVGNGDAMPFVVSFRRTSYTAGKKVATHFAKMSMLRAAPYAKTLKLTCKFEKNDKGSYYVFDIEQGRKSTAEEVAAAEMWKPIVSRGVKVDDSDLAKAPATGGDTFEEATDY